MLRKALDGIPGASELLGDGQNKPIEPPVAFLVPDARRDRDAQTLLEYVGRRTLSTHVVLRLPTQFGSGTTPAHHARVPTSSGMAGLANICVQHCYVYAPAETGPCTIGSTSPSCIPQISSCRLIKHRQLACMPTPIGMWWWVAKGRQARRQMRRARARRFREQHITSMRRCGADFWTIWTMGGLPTSRLTKNGAPGARV